LAAAIQFGGFNPWHREFCELVDLAFRASPGADQVEPAGRFRDGDPHRLDYEWSITPTAANVAALRATGFDWSDDARRLADRFGVREKVIEEVRHAMVKLAWHDEDKGRPESERIAQQDGAVLSVCRRLAAACSLTASDWDRLQDVLNKVAAGASGPELAAGLPSGKGLPELDAISAMYWEALNSGSRS
jgi:hypothetical protein